MYIFLTLGFALLSILLIVVWSPFSSCFILFHLEDEINNITDTIRTRTDSGRSGRWAATRIEGKLEKTTGETEETGTRGIYGTAGTGLGQSMIGTDGTGNFQQILSFIFYTELQCNFLLEFLDNKLMIDS